LTPEQGTNFEKVKNNRLTQPVIFFAKKKQQQVIILIANVIPVPVQALLFNFILITRT